MVGRADSVRNPSGGLPPVEVGGQLQVARSAQEGDLRMELSLDRMEFRRDPRLSVYSEVAEGTYVTPTDERLTFARANMDVAFTQMGVRLKALRLIDADAELITVGVDARSAVIRRIDGAKKTIDIARNLEQGSGDAALIVQFEIIERYMDGVLPTGHRKFPRSQFIGGNRGNLDPKAPSAFLAQPSFKLGALPEGHIEAQLDDLNVRLDRPIRPWKHTLKPEDRMSKVEYARQKQAALKMGAGSMAFFDVYSCGLQHEINQKQRELEDAKAQVQQAMQAQPHLGNLRDLLETRNRHQKELNILNDMKREVASVSYLALMSAERVRPTGDVRTEADFDRAAHEAYVATHRQLLSTSTHADEYAVGASALITVLKCRDITAQREAGNEALLEPMPERLEMVRMFRKMHMRHQKNLENPTLRFYEAYIARGQAPGQDWSLFMPEDYAGLFGEIRGRLGRYQTQALHAMREAVTQYQVKQSLIEKGLLNRTFKTSGEAANLRSVVVNPVTGPIKARITGAPDQPQGREARAQRVAAARGGAPAP